jgi:cobalt-zinc-cadmium efflux system protein
MAHAHDHHPAHHHAPGGSYGRAFALGIALNLVFVAAEATFGFIAHSVALLADAGHNLGDVLGLVLAWAGAALARLRPSARYTYGLRSTSIMAALANAVLLLIAVGAIALEAVQRLAAPAEVASATVIAVAALGIVINGATAWLFRHGHAHDINLRGAYLHLASDAAVSAGVVLAGIVIALTGWHWVDPAASLVVAAVIVVGTWQLLREAIKLSVQAVPGAIDPASVRIYLEAVAGVTALHDLHIWPISTTETALTCHLVMPGGHPGDAVLARVTDELHHRFRIQHVTLQIELGDTAAECVLTPDHVV